MEPEANQECGCLWLTLSDPLRDSLTEWKNVEFVERGLKRTLVRDHRFNRFQLADPGCLDYRGDERRRDVRGDRLAAFRRTLGRETIETELAETVIEPLVIGQLRRVDADQL